MVPLVNGGGTRDSAAIMIPGSRLSEEKRTGRNEKEQRNGLNLFSSSIWGARGAANPVRGGNKSDAHSRTGLVWEEMAQRSRISGEIRVSKEAKSSKSNNSLAPSRLFPSIFRSTFKSGTSSVNVFDYFLTNLSRKEIQRYHNIQVEESRIIHVGYVRKLSQWSIFLNDAIESYEVINNQKYFLLLSYLCHYLMR